MILNSISVVNFNGQNTTRQKITPAHIAAVSSDIHGNFIEQLDALGLINRSMLKKARKAAEIEKAKSTAQSVDTVADILKHPRFVIQHKDNGYWFEIEDPHNFRERMQSYAKGENYTTVGFSREREYLSALSNIQKNGNKTDCLRLSKIYSEALDTGLFENHEKMLSAWNKKFGLKFCIPQEGTSGKIIAADKHGISSFVTDSLIKPALKMANRKFIELATKTLRR